jgi:hypothetical protein
MKLSIWGYNTERVAKLQTESDVAEYQKKKAADSGMCHRPDCNGLRTKPISVSHALLLVLYG